MCAARDRWCIVVSAPALPLSLLSPSLSLGAAILAGGQARRMGGIAKGNLLRCYTENHNEQGITIMRRLLNEIVAAGIRQTVIVANDAAPYISYDVPIIPDLLRDVGPLAGIASALHYYDCAKLHGFDFPIHVFATDDSNIANLNNCANFGCAAVLFVPCDLPNFSAGEINRLIHAHFSHNCNRDDLVCINAATTFTTHAPITFAATGDNELHALCAIINVALLPALQRAIGGGQRKVRDVWRALGAQVVRFDDREKFTNINCVDDWIRQFA